MRPLALLLVLLTSLSACAHPYPVKYHYVVDVTNQVCAEYEIIDEKSIKFRLRREMPLVAKGKCDRAFGVTRDDVSKLLNWIRDEAANVGAVFVEPTSVEVENADTDTYNPALHRLY